MKTTMRLLLMAAMAASQWWAAAAPPPVLHVIESIVGQVARPEALANTFMRLDFIARCLRRAS